MPQYRLFFWDHANRIVGASAEDWPEQDVERQAAEALRNENGQVRAVEVWHLTQRVARITR